MNPTTNLLPIYRHCSKCRTVLLKTSYFKDNIYFYCASCQVYTIWNEGTKLQNSKLLHTQLEKLIILFLDKKSPKDACDVTFLTMILSTNT